MALSADHDREHGMPPRRTGTPAIEPLARGTDLAPFAPSASDYPALHTVAALVRALLVATLCGFLFIQGERIDWTLYGLAAALLVVSVGVMYACRQNRPSTVFSVAGITLEVLFLAELIGAWRTAGHDDARFLFILFYIPVLVAALLHGPPGAIYAAALAVFSFLARFGETEVLWRRLLLDMWLSHFVPLVLVAVLIAYLVTVAERERRRRAVRDEELLRSHQTIAMAQELHRATRPELSEHVPGAELVIRQANADTAFGGGDFCSILPLADGRYAICVADVAGKTIAGIATVPLAYAAFWVAAHHHQTPEECADEVDQLLQAATEPDVFVAFFIAFYDPPTGMLRWCNAGQPDAMLIQSGQTRLLYEGGPAVGAVPLPERGTYSGGEARLEPGGLLLIGTDGVLPPGAATFISQPPPEGTSLPALADRLLASAQIDDDRALVLLRRYPIAE